MNVMEVREKALEVIEKVRSGDGPYFLEVVTYRYRGHSMGDPERYRQSEEVKRWQEHDPIGIYHKYLLDQEIATQDEMDELDKKIEADVESAIQFAESSPEPEPEALFENVYVEEG